MPSFFKQKPVSFRLLGLPERAVQDRVICMIKTCLQFLVRLFLLASLLLPLSLGAQGFPRDPATGKILFAEEVPVMDGPKTDLYRRARAWLLQKGPSARTLVVDDTANGVLIAHAFAWIQVPGKRKGLYQTYKLWHTIKIEVENDRFWYSFYDLKVQEAGSPSAKAGPKLALERFLPSPAGPPKTRHPAPPPWAAQVQARMTILIQDLKVRMR